MDFLSSQYEKSDVHRAEKKSKNRTKTNWQIKFEVPECLSSSLEHVFGIPIPLLSTWDDRLG